MYSYVHNILILVYTKYLRQSSSILILLEIFVILKTIYSFSLSLSPYETR